MQSGTPDTHRGGKVVVAESPILTVESCPCGVLHLHFGPVTMRFTEAGLHDVHRTIAHALMRLVTPETASENVTSLFSATGPARGEA